MLSHSHREGSVFTAVVQVFDNAGAPTVSVHPPWGSNFAVDNTATVVYTATDESNNVATCSFNVTVRKITGIDSRLVSTGKKSQMTLIVCIQLDVEEVNF
jgi:HYR domain